MNGDFILVANNIQESIIKNIQNSIPFFKPEIALLVFFILALIFDIIFKKEKNVAGIVAIIGFIITGLFLVFQCTPVESTFANLVAIDPFAKFFKFIILISSLLVVLISFFSKELYEHSKSMGEYFSLIIGMTFGMFLLVGATNLIMIYLAIETMSLSSYILAGYTKEIKRASEASLKYVIYGAVSSGIMIYGISILFGLTGEFNIYEIYKYISTNSVDNFALWVSLLMIIAGFGYKISAVPFHFWTPDVYEGAPITITAYLSVASKAAGFAVLIRFIMVGFTNFGKDAEVLISSIDWVLVISILSVLSMTLGNLVALWQTNLKRLLAYSSIAHAGYMLLGVVVLDEVGISAVLIYFFVYLFMNLGAFYFVMLIANKINSEEIGDFTGIGYRAPFLSVCMVIFLISLTGLPPTAGFIGKLYIFTALLQTDKYIWLAVIGVLNSVVSLYYYVKIFRNMFVRGVDTNYEQLNFSAPSLIIMLIFAIPTLVFGVYFSPIVEWAKYSVQMFLGR